VFSRKIRRSATFDFCNTIGPLRHLVWRKRMSAFGRIADMAFRCRRLRM
jgi:hypothetical protein